MKSKRFRFWAKFALIVFIIWIVVGYIFARQLTQPVNADYPAITQLDSFKVEQKNILSFDGIKLNVWWVPNKNQKAVILLSGIHANSSQMRDRAKIYLANGFSVLFPDLRGEGKSQSAPITFGWNERHDLLACVRWLKTNGYASIAVHGCSLGAATIAYSLDSISDYSFVVMESCYDNIDHALAHRTFDSGFNRFLFWPVYFFTEMKIGATADDLSPLNRVMKYKGPLLYMAGDSEKYIPLKETHAIFAAFGSTKKSIRLFNGADHVDFYRFDPPSYSAVLTSFLQSQH